MNYLAIALVILIVIVIYYFFTFMTNNSLTAGLQPLNTPLSWTYDKLKNPASLQYSYQAWLFITAKPDSETSILFRGDDTSSKEFDVSLDNNLNLLVKAKVSTNMQTVMKVMGAFPLQKWVYLVVNVRQKNIEAYINGKLVKTVNVSGLDGPSMLAGLTAGSKTLQGYLTKLTRLPEVLDAQTVHNNYFKGNGLNNWFSSIFPYGMQFTVTSAESASRTIKLF